MTPPRWWRRIKALGACEEALAWARRYKTYRGMIRGCKWISWLEWLLLKHQTAWAEYSRACDAAWAEYGRVRAAAWAEYLRPRDAAWGKYARVCASALAKRKRACLLAARAACLGLPLGKEA